MCPSSMIVGEPPGLISAMLLPATSVVTRSAKVDASSRQRRAAGPSNPAGAGVSSQRFRKASEDGVSMERGLVSEQASSSASFDEYRTVDSNTRNRSRQGQGSVR